MRANMAHWISGLLVLGMVLSACTAVDGIAGSAGNPHVRSS